MNNVLWNVLVTCNAIGSRVISQESLTESPRASSMSFNWPPYSKRNSPYFFSCSSPTISKIAKCFKILWSEEHFQIMKIWFIHYGQHAEMQYHASEVLKIFLPFCFKSRHNFSYKRQKKECMEASGICSAHNHFC